MLKEHCARRRDWHLHRCKLLPQRSSRVDRRNEYCGAAMLPNGFFDRSDVAAIDLPAVETLVVVGEGDYIDSGGTQSAQSDSPQPPCATQHERSGIALPRLSLKKIARTCSELGRL